MTTINNTKLAPYNLEARELNTAATLHDATTGKFQAMEHLEPLYTAYHMLGTRWHTLADTYFRSISDGGTFIPALITHLVYMFMDSDTINDNPTIHDPSVYMKTQEAANEFMTCLDDFIPHTLGFGVEDQTWCHQFMNKHFRIDKLETNNPNRLLNSLTIITETLAGNPKPLFTEQTLYHLLKDNITMGYQNPLVDALYANFYTQHPATGEWCVTYPPETHNTTTVFTHNPTMIATPYHKSLNPTPDYVSGILNHIAQTLTQHQVYDYTGFHPDIYKNLSAIGKQEVDAAAEQYHELHRFITAINTLTLDTTNPHHKHIIERILHAGAGLDLPMLYMVRVLSLTYRDNTITMDEDRLNTMVAWVRNITECYPIDNEDQLTRIYLRLIEDNLHNRIPELLVMPPQVMCDTLKINETIRHTEGYRFGGREDLGLLTPNPITPLTGK